MRSELRNIVEVHNQLDASPEQAVDVVLSVPDERIIDTVSAYLTRKHQLDPQLMPRLLERIALKSPEDYACLRHLLEQVMSGRYFTVGATFDHLQMKQIIKAALLHDRGDRLSILHAIFECCCDLFTPEDMTLKKLTVLDTDYIRNNYDYARATLDLLGRFHHTDRARELEMAKQLDHATYLRTLQMIQQQNQSFKTVSNFIDQYRK
jgi:hypothetical protein